MLQSQSCQVAQKQQSVFMKPIIFKISILSKITPDPCLFLEDLLIYKQQSSQLTEPIIVVSQQLNSMGQLTALFYKNWILYKRSLCGNLLELIIPIFFILFIVIARRLDQPTNYAEQSFYANPLYSQTIKDDTIPTAFLKKCPPNTVVGLIPSDNNLVSNLNTRLTTLGQQTQIFRDESSLESYIRDSSYSTNIGICFAIVVQSSINGGSYQYKLRFNISSVLAKSDGPSTSLKTTQDKALDITTYNQSLVLGMIGANTLVNNAIYQIEANSTSNYLKHSVAPVYQQKFTLDEIYADLSTTIGILVLLPLLLIYLRQTSAMMFEKQTKVRESMSIMGMQLKYYYFTWFIRYFAVYFILHLICAAIIVNQFTIIPFYIPFIVFILFDIVLIVQNFFIQVFLSRAKIGVVISLLFFVLQYVISFVSTNSDNPTLSVNIWVSIVPHAAYILAFQTMLYSQSSQITPTFTQETNNYVIGYAIASFIINILLYIVLTWYLDQVFPNEWGAKKHPLFCFFNKHITRYTAEEKERIKQEQMEKEGYANSHEQIDQHLLLLEKDNKLIEVIGLKKSFGQTIAVQNLNINMYNNQIFALLGHNGAGKTTVISMLTGMIEPTDGYISVMGETQLDKIRAMIGVCPQHDTLYEELTVEEHLELFSSFKGLQNQQLRNQVDKLINDVNLREKRQQYSKNLSGGQKRRLSVALAFAGRSKIIILDQPTSGMDTSARRYIWQLLKTYKNDRIIILTTHFMDEADYLGDRIGIMGDGKFICCGSSMFLKNKFGVGYNLTFVKISDTADGNALINLVKRYVPNAKVLSNVAADLSLQLPLENVDHFPLLFKELDQKKEQLKYLQYGISITTLEQVFLKVGEQLQKSRSRRESKIIDKSFSTKINKIEEYSDRSPVEKQLIAAQTNQILAKINFDEIPHELGTCNQFWIHFYATFLKRFRVIRRDWKSFIFQLVLPIIIMISALFIMRISFVTDQSSLTINLNLYLSEQNPVIVPITSSDPDFAPIIASELLIRYGSLMSVLSNTSYTTPASFDQVYLYPLKLKQSTLKGGIFFKKPAVTDTVLQFTTLANTRSPTSYFFLQTLAAQTIINNVLAKNISITATNYPLPRTYSQLQDNNAISGFFGSFIFTLALAFKFASIIAFIVKQRQDQSKHQQLVSGMKISAYWISNFVYDFILFLIIAVIGCGFCKAFQISSFTSGNAFPATCFLFLLYGLSYISFTYIFGFLFKDYGNAQAGYYFLTLIIGGMLPILTFLLRFIKSVSNPYGRGLAWIFRIYPSFAFGEGLINMGSGSLYGIFENNGVSLDPLDLQMALAPIIYLALEVPLYFGILFLVQFLINNEEFMRKFLSQSNVNDNKPIKQSDVLQQYQRANSAEPEDYEILTKKLRKVYAVESIRKYKIAVDNLSFAIKRGEVFGLLGVNGAGKSTTFKMLSGQITSTSGECFFNGLKVSQNIDIIRKSLGYCPQFDPLIQNLTVRQQLQLFYDLKSLVKSQKQGAITKKIQQMSLKQYEDKLSGTLSGGNKRKLSVAVAMIGNPRIIFLDQPSTGMDPKAKRFMWKVISRVATQKKNATVILTTHSMQEAEALSSRLGIMVKGNFQCIGTPQHIKTKYGEGFEIEVKLQPFQRDYILKIVQHLKLQGALIGKDDIDRVLNLLKLQPEDRLEISESGTGNYIYNQLQKKKKIEAWTLTQFSQICKLHRKIINSLTAEAGEVQILERIQTFIRLKAIKRAKVSQLFDFFERKKAELNIQQYTIKQASVEQIFNRFAENGDETEYGG